MWLNPEPNVAILCVSTNDQRIQSNVWRPINYRVWSSLNISVKFDQNRQIYSKYSWLGVGENTISKIPLAVKLANHRVSCLVILVWYRWRYWYFEEHGCLDRTKNREWTKNLVHFTNQTFSTVRSGQLCLKDSYSSFLSDFKSKPIIILKNQLTKVSFLLVQINWPIRIHLISFGVGIGGETHLSISLEWYPLEAVESIGEVFERCWIKSFSDGPIKSFFGSSIVSGWGGGSNGGAVERGDCSKCPGPGLGRYAGPYSVDRHAGVEKWRRRPS